MLYIWPLYITILYLFLFLSSFFSCHTQIVLPVIYCWSSSTISIDIKCWRISVIQISGNWHFRGDSLSSSHNFTHSVTKVQTLTTFITLIPSQTNTLFPHPKYLSIPSHALPYYRIPCHTIQYNSIPSNTIQFPPNQFNKY